MIRVAMNFLTETVEVTKKCAEIRGTTNKTHMLSESIRLYLSILEVIKNGTNEKIILLPNQLIDGKKRNVEITIAEKTDDKKFPESTILEDNPELREEVLKSYQDVKDGKTIPMDKLMEVLDSDDKGSNDGKVYTIEEIEEMLDPTD